MWHKLKNLFLNINTYADLSPDLTIRWQVNRALNKRCALTRDEWFETLWKPLDVDRQVAAFVYTQFEQYSGLTFSRVLPHDRLEADLHWTLVCWFDWEETLGQDIVAQFGLDISDDLLGREWDTVADLVLFLNRRVIAVNSIESV